MKCSADYAQMLLRDLYSLYRDCARAMGCKENGGDIGLGHLCMGFTARQLVPYSHVEIISRQD
jgi:hypothetical protein